MTENIWSQKKNLIHNIWQLQNIRTCLANSALQGREQHSCVHNHKHFAKSTRLACHLSGTLEQKKTENA